MNMDYVEKRRYYRWLFGGFIGVLGLLVLVSSTLGAANISIPEAFRIILSRVPGIGKRISLEDIQGSYITIIWNIRLPRIVLGGLVGMGLAVVGTSFQGMFKNPMADPYVLGVSSGAAVGAAIGIVLGLERGFLGYGYITLLAFAGALIATITVYQIARVGNKVPTVTLLLAGISISFLLSSIISILMVFHRNQVEKIVFWTMGSLNAASWKQVYTLLPFVLGGVIAIGCYSRDLNSIQMGEETAQSLGVEVELVKKLLLVISSFVAAAVVSVSGIIGFVGLIIPHIIRLFVGPDHRLVIPFSAVGGAIFMIFSDTLARTLIPPTEIPVGAVTALFGAPYFIYLLMKAKKR